MKPLLVEELDGFQLLLAFMFAKGYSDFSYSDALQGWRIEQQISEMRLTSVMIIPDEKYNYAHVSPYLFPMTMTHNLSSVLDNMRHENICLSWDKEHYFPKLYFEAFPEIYAVNERLHLAYQQVMVKKELGDEISIDLQKELNFDKSRKCHDPVFA